ncbi:MAG: hypothetical protein LBM25_01710 [Bacteroidales bacterium]|nr:hypothetical protein [Bacteroidales bacterium]
MRGNKVVEENLSLEDCSSREIACSLRLKGEVEGVNVRYDNGEFLSGAELNNPKVKSDKSNCKCVPMEEGTEAEAEAEAIPAVDPLVEVFAIGLVGVVSAVKTKYDDNSEQYLENEIAKKEAASDAVLRNGGNTRVPKIPQAKPKTEKKVLKTNKNIDKEEEGEICNDTTICSKEQIEKAKKELELLNL